MFSPSLLWKTPEINPINNKARSIPVLNVVDKYGRVFFFSWFGFFIAFWSWYAFPPLLTVTIKADLRMSTADVANSNISALTGTLLVRFLAGPLCDRFGPRWVFIGVLLAGSIPTAMAGLVRSTNGLIALRFFIGILGGSFVPCQVWSTAFFDRNVVGSANALIGGWGNSGGGITYFLMPVIYDSLRIDQHLSPSVAWRVAFIVPFILITCTATGMIFLCPDTPTGKWSERHQAAQALLLVQESQPTILSSEPKSIVPITTEANHSSGTSTPTGDKKSTGLDKPTQSKTDVEKGTMQDANMLAQQDKLDIAKGEIVVAPSTMEILHILMSPQTLFHAATYFCSFGGELAINSYLGAYYLKNFPHLGQTGSGRWAAMFGLLNVVTRPLGGVIADILYEHTKSVWIKKFWIVFVGVVSGAFLIAIGQTDPHHESKMFGLIAAMAVFLEAGNGANFALVPHVHPYANGVISGITGAAGNLGGVVFAILFRFHGKNYAASFWIAGIMVIVLNLAFCWIRPIPKGQLGGR